jgi:hypothetical protein
MGEVVRFPSGRVESGASPAPDIPLPPRPMDQSAALLCEGNKITCDLPGGFRAVATAESPGGNA